MARKPPKRELSGTIAITTAGGQKLELALKGFGRDIKAIAGETLEILAEKYLQLLRQGIRAHVLAGMEWPPLKASTRRLHGSHHILMMTGSYYRMLRIRKSVARGSPSFFIGPQEGDVHVRVDEDGNTISVPMTKLAQILEFGNPDNRMFGKASAPIPPRPHIRPAMEFFVRKLAGKVINEDGVKRMKVRWG